MTLSTVTAHGPAEEFRGDAAVEYDELRRGLT